MVDWEAVEANVEEHAEEAERRRIQQRVAHERAGVHHLYPAIVATSLLGPWLMVGAYVAFGGAVEDGWWWRTAVYGTLYFLPSLLAFKRLHASSILAVNLMLGWSGIAWVVCLAWAFLGETYSGRRHDRYMKVEKPRRDANARPLSVPTNF